MKQKDEIQEIQELLFIALPAWNYQIVKPLKQFLDDGMSLGMYYCLQTLLYYKEGLTMSELARCNDMTKQQMTKLINRLVELGFVERIYDPHDRRIIRIQATDHAIDYINSFLEHNAGYLRTLLENMEKTDRLAFKKALLTFIKVLVEKNPPVPFK